jgi:uncharacterized protein (DUF934 family)
MRRIIKDLRIIADECQHLADEAALPVQGRFTVSLVRWRKERETLAGSAGRLGVRIPNTEDIDALWPELAGVAMIVLEFPKFGDGRAFSQASVLRRHLGFNGEIRATGDVLRDQMLYMRRCGIDVFEPREDRSIEDALKAFSEYSEYYQAASDTGSAIHLRRRAGTA